MMKYDAPYEFVIDTNSYAGNFERELCAYVTGYWDNETHGGDQAAVFEEEVGKTNPFDDYVMYAITKCNSIGIFFSQPPTKELVELMKERAHKFCKEGLVFRKPVKGDDGKPLEILGFRMFKQTKNVEEVVIP